jgi:hypothetical protein
VAGSGTGGNGKPPGPNISRYVAASTSTTSSSGADRSISGIDLVGADREPVAQRISFVGSIKWRDHHPFDERDLAELIAHRSRMPGADESTPLLAVARSTVAVDSPRALGPEDLLAAWRR